MRFLNKILSREVKIMKKYFSIPEVAEINRCSQQTIHNQIKAGKLRCEKFGSRSTVILKEDLEAFLEKKNVYLVD